jgi:hypothetical protein
LDGKSFWLHENLHEALQGIRDPEQTLMLWTDKICINQDNLSERNAQVQRMGETYSQAEEVLIWLGSTPKGCAHLEFYENALKNHLTMSQVDWAHAFPSILYIMNRPWVERVWVLQEAILPPRGRVFLGHECIDAATFFRFHEVEWTRVMKVLNQGPVLASIIDSLNEGEELELLRWVWDENSNGDDIAKSLSRVRLFKNISSFCRNAHAFIGDSPWGSLLSLTRHRHCHDRRDYVFGIAGLLQLFNADWQGVGYSLSTEEVFIKAATNMLAGDIDTLLWTLDDEIDSTELDRAPMSLPLWVPDFSKGALPFAPFLADMYRAGGDERVALFSDTSTFTPHTLRVSGYFCDHVMDISADNRHQREFSRRSPSEIALLEERFVTDEQTSSPYGDYNGRLNAFWRTLVADLFSTGDNQYEGYRPNDSGADYEVFLGRAEWRQGFIGPLTMEQADRRRCFPGTLNDLSYGRPFFRTRYGFLGLGPRREIMQGDLILIVPGLNMPIMVRRLSQDKTNLRVRLLGSCYVHGLMDGEVIELFKNPEIIDKVEDEHSEIIEKLKEEGLALEQQVFEIV